MRILLKKTQEGWKVRFPSGNPWKMPVAEWLSVTGDFYEAPAHFVTAHLMADFPSSNVFTLCPDVFSLVLTCGVIGLILSRSPLSAEGDPSAYVLALSGLAFLLGSAGVIRDKSCREGGYGPR